LVFPGWAATPTFFDPQSTLMTELLPTFGYPTIPIVYHPDFELGSPHLYIHIVKSKSRSSSQV